MPRKIKKYANRKFYDTMEKKYVSLDELSELIKSGEEVSVEDNETGEDLTSSVLAQLLAREKNGENKEIPSGLLIELLRKGGDTVIDYAKRYTGLWQSTLTMAEDEVDKLVNKLVKTKDISQSEAGRLKKEILGYADNFKKWITDKVDYRVNEVMNKMNLATKEQVAELTDKMEALTEKVEKLEKSSAK